jgi:hypothetical protein
MARVRRKSINDIERQRNRIIRLGAELTTGRQSDFNMSNRGQRINDIADRYQRNIHNGPNGYNPDENRRVPRSQYMGLANGGNAG